MNNERISYKVIANVGTLAKYPTGWSKEVNIVSWNEGPAKLDVRDWSPEHDKMSRGITLNADEVQRLLDSVQSRDAIAMLKIPAGIAPPFQQMGTAIPEIRYRYSCSWIPRI